MTVAIYARVSTQVQETNRQLDPLREFVRRMKWTAIEYLEKESSVKRRPVFDLMIADARLRKFDGVLVWEIDRFARSMNQFVSTVLQLDNAGVWLRALNQNISSERQDPMGQFVLGLFALLAQFERAMIVARVKDGLAAARARGRVGGRPRKVFRRDEAAEMRKNGESWRSIARKLDVPQATIRRVLAE
jgi:DNA invertase Pin-like site-specific DNA recombinase